MSGFDPRQLAEWSGGHWHADQYPAQIVGFCFDARQLKPGECFVALSGGARDGHDFVAQAAERGASAVIVERAQPLALPQLLVGNTLLALGALGAALRRGFAGPVVGITGSCGKTSTKEMLRCLLGEGRTHATAGNYNNRLGVPMTLLGLDAQRHAFAVIEAGINQPDEMALLGAMIEADLSVVTNIAAAHLERLGSIDTVAVEKAQLARAARPNAPVLMPSEVFRHAAFSALADRAVVLAAEGERLPVPPMRVVRYRLEQAAGVTSRLYLTDAAATCFSIASSSAGICVNAALAIVAARELGIADEALRARMAAWRPAATRGRIAQAGAQTFYIDCYNANPASMADALDAFRRAMAPARARCYVLGAMNELGPDAVDMHRRIGRSLALRPADRAVFIGPPSLAAAYRQGAQEGGAAAAQLLVAPDVASIQSELTGFDGALFLKGSRSYALEKLLPSQLL